MASPFLVHLVLSALVSHAISFVHGFGFGPHIRPLTIQRSSGSFSASPTRPRIVGFRSKLYTSSDESNESGGVRYLGSGDNAIIRPGVVLVAPSHEYDHFLRESAVFVYAIGLDDDENTIIRGVVLDHPTAFAIGEMSPFVTGSLSNNTLFRGGYDGSDTAMLLHSGGGPEGSVSSDDEIGSSGIYEGGIVSAMESADAGAIQTNQCKFFFNFMEFTGQQLDDMFHGTEDGDMWMSLEVPTEYILNSDYSRGQLWAKLRNQSQGLKT